MIIAKFLEIITALARTFLPTIAVSSGFIANITSAIMTISDFCMDANFIVPLPDIVLIISIDLAIRIFKVSLFCGNWVFRRVMDIIP